MWSATMRFSEQIFVAHMGAFSGTHRRNSLAAVRECIEQGVERVEIDVHSLAGDDYIVTHDRRLEQHTTGQGAVGRATPDEVRALRFVDAVDDRPALLSEVAQAARDSDTELQLDLKDWRPLTSERVAALLQVVAPVRERVIVTTGQDWNLRLLNEADDSLAVGFDPGLYFDHAIEGADVILPARMGAYGYRDDHPLALGRASETSEYLRLRFAELAAMTVWAREWFINWRLVLQMLDDGFDVAAWLRERGVETNVWTLDYDGDQAMHVLARLRDIGVRRVTTNTMRSWLGALNPQPA